MAISLRKAIQQRKAIFATYKRQISSIDTTVNLIRRIVDKTLDVDRAPEEQDRLRINQELLKLGALFDDFALVTAKSLPIGQ